MLLIIDIMIDGRPLFSHFFDMDDGKIKILDKLPICTLHLCQFLSLSRCARKFPYSNHQKLNQYTPNFCATLGNFDVLVCNSLLVPYEVRRNCEILRALEETTPYFSFAKESLFELL